VFKVGSHFCFHRRLVLTAEKTALCAISTIVFNFTELLIFVCVFVSLLINGALRKWSRLYRGISKKIRIARGVAPLLKTVRQL